MRIKVQQTSIDIFSNQTSLDLIDYSFQFTKIKMTMLKYLKYYLPKGLIDNYNVITSGKNFQDQPNDSDIKRYEKIRKITTGKGGGYIIGCLLDYGYIKSN